MRPLHRTRSFLIFATCLLALLSLHVEDAWSEDTHAAFYSHANNEIFWFIQVSDTHIGARGSQDSDSLRWLVTEGKTTVNPNFIVVSGDLTDSTNGNLFGIPNGPYQSEWDEYKSILSQGNNINATNFFDLPGNHDAYSDQYFNYYRANSIQGWATGSTQVSWSRTFDYGKYHFLGINTADNSGDPFSWSSPWGDYAGLDTSELSFIANDLNANSDADLTFVFGHHPVTDTGDSQDTWLYYGQSEFISLLDQYGASLYGYGHTHNYSEELFTGNAYTGFMDGDGIVYLNINSLGKSTENNFSVIAIDCNGISTRTQAIGVWPLVMITAPVDIYLGDAPNLDPNPYSYPIPDAIDNPIRALVFDKNTVSSVQYRIDAETGWHPMQPVAGNPYLWEAEWNASAVSPEEHTIQVQAVGTTTRADIISVVVSSTNQPPVAQNQSINTDEDTLTTIQLTGSDPDSDPLTFQVSSPPGHGSLSGTAPNMIYTPDDDYNGIDSLDFVAFDGTAYSDPATVTITVRPVNDTPFAEDDAYETNQAVTLTVPAPGVLANDTDIDGDTLAAAVVSTPDSGTLILNSDGGFAYTPNPGFSGPDGFTYKASDGTTDSTLATVTITVHQVSQPDTTPPQPSPMTWAIVPHALDSQSISMTATAATDESGVEYYFECVSGPCHDSVWQASDTYMDTGLNPDTSYGYRVTARDLSTAGPNTGLPSEVKTATTESSNATFNADSETSTRGTVDGSYLDTNGDDENEEWLTEEIKSGRWSLLEHTYTFNVNGQASMMFFVKAYHDENSEGDDFVFAYSLDNATFTNMLVVTAVSEPEGHQSFVLPSYISGTVYVRVTDTDRTKGNVGTDTLYVDDMYILTSAGSGLPPEPAYGPAPPDGDTSVSPTPTLYWSAGTGATGHDVYFGIDGSNLPRVSADQPTSSYPPGQLSAGTTYYWRIDEVNSEGTTTGDVWSFTTMGGDSCTSVEVSSISLATVRGAAGTSYGQAIITIMDNCGNPVEGAEVTGHFTGSFSDESTQPTDVNGEAVFTTGTSLKKPSFDFVVSNVVAENMTYVPQP